MPIIKEASEPMKRMLPTQSMFRAFSFWEAFGRGLIEGRRRTYTGEKTAPMTRFM
jgi:hypothetical protein